MAKKYVKPLYIAFDYDGTFTKESKFPYDGEINPLILGLAKRLQERGHKVILWTCRNSSEQTAVGNALDAAVDNLISHGLIPDAVNKNPYVNFAGHPKIFYNYLIDDLAVGYRSFLKLLEERGADEIIDMMERKEL